MVLKFQLTPHLVFMYPSQFMGSVPFSAGQVKTIPDDLEVRENPSRGYYNNGKPSHQIYMEGYYNNGKPSQWEGENPSNLHGKPSRINCAVCYIVFNCCFCDI